MHISGAVWVDVDVDDDEAIIKKKSIANLMRPSKIANFFNFFFATSNTFMQESQLQNVK